MGDEGGIAVAEMLSTNRWARAQNGGYYMGFRRGFPWFSIKFHPFSTVFKCFQVFSTLFQLFSAACSICEDLAAPEPGDQRPPLGLGGRPAARGAGPPVAAGPGPGGQRHPGGPVAKALSVSQGAEKRR